MMLTPLRKIFPLFIFFCFSQVSEARSLQEIKRSGKLYAAFTEWDYRNINYPLALEFARYLNVQLVEVPILWDEAFSRDGTIPFDLETNSDLSYTPDALKRADILCSTFSTVAWRKKLFDYAETLYSSELLIIPAEDPSPTDYSDLKGKKIAYMTGTTFEYHLREVNKLIGGGMVLLPVASEEDSKKMLLKGEVDGIVLDADEALDFIAQNKNKLQQAFPVSPITRSAWAVEKNSDLRTEVEDFFEAISANDVLDRIFYDKFNLAYSSFVNDIRKKSHLQVLHRDLDEILDSKRLVVAFRERNFIYREGEHKQFMHALAQEFADYLGVKLEFIITPNSAKYWENNEGIIVKDSSYSPEWFNHFDLACEIFASAEWRTNKVNEISIFPAEYVVVARKKTNLNSMEDLSRFEGVTAEGTLYEDILQKRNIKAFHYAQVDQFLEEVNSGRADYAIIMNAFFELSSYPELELKFSVGETEICWALRKDQPKLEKKLRQFFDESRKDGPIRTLDLVLHGNQRMSGEIVVNGYGGYMPYILYDTLDGLPGRDVISIMEDSHGHLWFGTSEGLVCYEGKGMRPAKGAVQYKGMVIRSMAKSGTSLYLATPRGIVVLSQDVVKQVLFPEEAFSLVAVDAFGNIWMKSDKGIYCMDRQGLVINHSKAYPELNSINAFCFTSNLQELFLAGEAGVFHYQEVGKTFSKVCNRQCFAITSDANDSIWLSFKDGLYLISSSDLQNKRCEAARQLNSSLAIPHIPFRQIVQSRFGSIWLVSDYRLFLVSSTNKPALSFEQEIGLKNNTIHTLFEDSEDNLWIGFSGGLQRISNRRGLRNFFPNILNSALHTILEDQNGHFWIASERGIFNYQSQLTEISKQYEQVGGMTVAGKLSDGNLVFAGPKGLVMLEPGNLHVLRNSIFQQECKKLEKLFVTARGELFLLTGERGHIYYLRHPGAQPIPFMNRATTAVSSLIEYNGEVIGGNKFGLIGFNGLEFRQTHELGVAVHALCFNDGILWLATDDGLKIFENNQIKDIAFYRKDKRIIKAIAPAQNSAYLWLATDKGLSYFSKQSLTEDFIVDSKDGLNSDDILDGGLMVDSKGVLWISTQRGLSSFNIRAAAIHNFSPVCYIERMLVNGIETAVGSKSIFTHHQNNILFKLSALSFSDEDFTEFEYTLHEKNNGYSSYSSGKDYKAGFLNLPPGKYEFIFKAKGKNGTWGFPQKYSFVIMKAWYETWFFRIAFMLTILAGTWFIFRKRVQFLLTENTKLHEKEEAQSASLSKLKEQISIKDFSLKEQQGMISESSYLTSKIRESVASVHQDLQRISTDYFLLRTSPDDFSPLVCQTANADEKTLVIMAGTNCNGLPAMLFDVVVFNGIQKTFREETNWQASGILDALHTFIFSRGDVPEERGTDYNYSLAVCLFDRLHGTLSYAGAGIQLCIVQGGVLRNTGVMAGVPDTQTVELVKGDQVYLFYGAYTAPDREQDNAVSEEEALMRFLSEIKHLPMRQQKDMLAHHYEKWKAGSEQQINATVVGIRI